MFRFRDAIKTPVLIYGPCKLSNLNGQIKFTVPIRRGLLIIGASDPVRSFDSKSFLDIQGNLVCGGSVTLRRGVRIQIHPGGNLHLCDDVFVGDNNTFISKCSITLGFATRVGNNTTFMDTDFHYIVNTENGRVNNAEAAIDIGENNWIGGNCVIKKGAQTPKGTILAGPYSMISKNYNKLIRQNSIIAGSPAKLVAENYRRINNDCQQSRLVEFFRNNTSPYCFQGIVDYDRICLPSN